MYGIELLLYRYLPLPIYWVLRAAATLLTPGRSNSRQRLAIDLPVLPSARTIWFHAASVGEISTIAPLVEEIRQRFPKHSLIVTTMTQNGMKRAANLLESTPVRLLPLDFLPAVSRMIRAVRPITLIIGETEIWPNLIIEAKRYGAKVVLVNGRISLKSFRWYRLAGAMMRKVLACFDYFLMRTPEDAIRIKSLGADESRVEVAGNTKFDILPKPIPEDRKREIRKKMGIPPERPVITLGSVRDGEMEVLIEALAPAIASSKALVIVAPRHLNILPLIAEILNTHGYKYGSIDSETPFGPADAGSLDFLIVGEMGRLLEMYAIADIAIIGGTFKPFGGHNPLEPASQGATTIVGPHIENITDDIEYLKSHECVFVSDPANLSHLVIDLLANEHKRMAIARKAVRAIRNKKGIASRCVDIMIERGLLPESHNEDY